MWRWDSDHDPAALRQRLRGMLGLVPPHDDGEERRLLLPSTRHRHPEHRSGDAALGAPELGLVGEVAGERDGAGVGAGLAGGRSLACLDEGGRAHRGLRFRTAHSRAHTAQSGPEMLGAGVGGMQPPDPGRVNSDLCRNR